MSPDLPAAARRADQLSQPPGVWAHLTAPRGVPAGRDVGHQPVQPLPVLWGLRVCRPGACATGGGEQAERCFVDSGPPACTSMAGSAMPTVSAFDAAKARHPKSVCVTGHDMHVFTWRVGVAGNQGVEAALRAAPDGCMRGVGGLPGRQQLPVLQGGQSQRWARGFTVCRHTQQHRMPARAHTG